MIEHLGVILLRHEQRAAMASDDFDALSATRCLPRAFVSSVHSRKVALDLFGRARRQIYKAPGPLVLAGGLRARLRSAERFSRPFLSVGCLCHAARTTNRWRPLLQQPNSRTGVSFTKERDMSPKDRTLKAMIDEKLDQALRDSFPASDPVSFIEPVPVKEGDRKLTVVEAAKRMRKRKATRS